MLKEVESVVNSRPLVYVDDDVNLNITLAPGHFLSLNPRTGIPNLEIQIYENYNLQQSTVEEYKEYRPNAQLLWYKIDWILLPF